MSTRLSVLVGGAVSIALLGYLAAYIDLAAARAALSTVPASSLVLVAAAMLASVWLGAVRLRILAGDLGYSLAMPGALSAVAMGQLAGAAFMQLVGQLLARSLVLRQSGVPVSASIFVTLYERLLALGVSFAMALAGALHIFGMIGIDLKRGGSDFVLLAIGGGAALALSAALAWGPMARAAIGHLDARSALRVLRNAAITLAIHLCTLAAFMFMALTLAPQSRFIDVAAASAVVMFASALPISMAGWGVRELTAVFALGAIGVPAATALVAGLLLGLAALVTNAGVALGVAALARPVAAAAESTGVPDRSGLVLGHLIPIGAGIAVLFQAQVLVGTDRINVNIADPLVLIGAALFVAASIPHWPAWRLERLTLYVGLMTAAVLLAFLHGIVTVGWSQWAAVNKTVGWFVLLSYGMTGALIVRTAGPDGRDILLRTITAGVAAIVALEAVADLTTIAGFKPLFATLRAEGFAYDANAFAFQILLALCIVLPLIGQWSAAGALSAALVLGLALTGSRSGWVGMLAVLFAGVAVSPAHMRRAAPWLFAGAIAGAALLAAFAWTPHAKSGEVAQSKETGAAISTLVFRDNRAVSSREHAQTMRAGLEQFLQSPLIGNGLGYFIESYGRARGLDHPIDSTGIWLLAEFGLIGFAIFVVPFTLALRGAWRDAREGDAAATTLLLALVAFGAMSQFYELLYQRLFWLLLGVLLALPQGRKTTA